MQNKNVLFLTVILFLTGILLSTSCKKDKDDGANTPDPTPTNNQGLGDNSGFPTGTPYVLPSFVTIVGEIRGGESYDKSMPHIKKATLQQPNSISDKQNWEYYGSGTYVNLYIQLYNTLQEDTLVVIPGGLIFVDSTLTYQHGFILQSVTIPLVANDTTFAIVRAYCCNLSRHGSDWEAVYHFGNISNNSELSKIVTILKTKQIPLIEDWATTSEIQSIIWDITDYNEVLTSTQLDYLNSLP